MRTSCEAARTDVLCAWLSLSASTAATSSEIAVQRQFARSPVLGYVSNLWS